MIKKILELSENEIKNISFSEINKEELNIGLFFIGTRLFLNNFEVDIIGCYYKKLDSIYNKKDIKNTTDWFKKFDLIINNFHEEDFIDFLNYSKILYISLYGNTEGIKNYKDLLKLKIIGNGDTILYKKLIKDNKKIVSFLEEELRKLFKNYSKNHEYEIGFLIDSLYGYTGNQKLDNKGENDRYDFWRKYKEKGVVKLLED